MENDEYWYNVKQDGDNIVVEKKTKKCNLSVDKAENSNEIVMSPKSKKKFLIISIISLVLVFSVLFSIGLFNSFNKKSEFKHRTFMLYMVGSDLESSGSIATFDLNDIDGSSVDLDNNNVVLMVGGSKKWHNFVDENEIGIYELTRSGFKKVKSKYISSMGASGTLSSFLEYSYDNYPAENYDMIFWNHGLGALGIESDEISEDFLDITELDSVFKDSIFAKEKLELVIFNNCLSSNLHIASIMKKYAKYMVASEEVMYVSLFIDRLNFLNDVKVNDSAYDIGKLYITKSDESMKKINKLKSTNLDSTLSLIDLSEIDLIEKNMDDFFESINLDDNYRKISIARLLTHTYGGEDYSYDTVDLYELATNLSIYSDSNVVQRLQQSINSAVKYNSSFNKYSNGISIYFPFFGSSEYVNMHLLLFSKLWENNYITFINNYYDMSSSAKRANRSGNDGTPMLKNKFNYIDNMINIELTEDELEKFQNSSIYIFRKIDDKYQLLLKSNQYNLNNNNILSFNNLELLETDNNNYVSTIIENDVYKVYGKINDSDVIVKHNINNRISSIREVFLDSGDKPVGGLFDYNDEKINYYLNSYKILDNDKIDENWKESLEKINVNNEKNTLALKDDDLHNYYALIEMRDINNDIFYSSLDIIN